MLLIQASLVTVVPKTCVKTIGFIVLTVLVIVLVQFGIVEVRPPGY